MHSTEGKITSLIFQKINYIKRIEVNKKQKFFSKINEVVLSLDKEYPSQMMSPWQSSKMC